MTDHPCKGMTPKQIEVFELVAVSGDFRAQQKTLDALLERGVIVRCADVQVGRDAFGPIMVPQYDVPLPVHMQWCAWAAEQES